MTIVAISTATATAGGIGIVRMSGEKALSIAQEIFTVKGESLDAPEPNKMILGTLSGKNFKEKAFCVFYKAPKSYTGEDVVEFHCHGGLTLLSAVVELCVEKGARPATRGEFTKRAFLNRKITLDEAEGIADVIEAESTAELNQAYRLMTGKTGQEIEKVSDLLVDACAELEVALDYPEEVDERDLGKAEKYLIDAQKSLEKMLLDAKKRRIIKSGANVCIAGAPNVGKSSLLNALILEDRAIVTDIAGTTRDVLKESIELKGVKINFIDTAGIRDTDDVVEKIGVEKAENEVKCADLVLKIYDLTCENKDIEKGDKDILVGNKADMGKPDERMDLMVSAKTGEGIENLIDAILKKLNVEEIAHSSIVMKDRHISAINTALGYLNSVIRDYKTATSDCLLVDIRSAIDELYRIEGKDVTEDVIDNIFDKFCVGK